ncbi:FUBP3 [Symbiodinium natans]|uniref:FUBP3 protein n=1 Tax=Symbiodinium natans TaxID=878477 RepID=A0A812S3K8_9DINO|nr:FUBP3 [Symbiodinium natans]
MGIPEIFGGTLCGTWRDSDFLRDVRGVGTPGYSAGPLWMAFQEYSVQSADVVSYDRFCLYTCKPLLTDEIKPVVDCAHLNSDEITELAQSPSSNGREIVYEAHPLTRVQPISRFVQLPEVGRLNIALNK